MYYFTTKTHLSACVVKKYQTTFADLFINQRRLMTTSARTQKRAITESPDEHEQIDIDAFERRNVYNNALPYIS